MPKLIEISSLAHWYLDNGFTPDVLPGCCNFVTHCIGAAGGNLGIINYVPHLVDLCEVIPSDKVEPGMLAVFERTYDAMAPAGIGPEDDMTHIGVYVGDGYFIDFGGSPAGVRKQKFEGYWKEHLQFFMKPPGFESAGSTGEPVAESHNIKFFYHPAVPKIKMVVDGREEWVDEMMLSVRTENNRELFILSHGFEEYPYLNLNKTRGKIKAVEGHIKWDVGSSK